MFPRKFRRLRGAALFYTACALSVLLLLVNYNEDVKRLLQPTEGSVHHGHPLSSSFQKKQREEQGGGGGSGSAGGDDVGIPVQEEWDDKRGRPWYISGGTVYPSLTHSTPLLHENNRNNDRIQEQLMFFVDEQRNLTEEPPPPLTSSPPETTSPKDPHPNNDLQPSSLLPTSEGGGGVGNKSAGIRGKLKTILLYYGLGMNWGPHVTTGRNVFLQQKCPVNSCRLTGNRAHITRSDIVLFKDVFMNPKVRRNPSQLWIIYMLECPLNTQNFPDKNVFNLTATYRHDSDIVTPYEKWVYFDENVKTIKQGINYAEGKNKKVAWFVSNCVAKNNRLDYARELSKYIQVDIYGACGTHSCSRANAKQCFDLLTKNYKFYLAFENSNCRDYISEKFFVNGLGNNVLPIVMGAHPDDYRRSAPIKSYIHVDEFPSPKELAEHLNLLDQNDDLYNEYFQWKGTGEFINTHFFCRLCAMAHYADQVYRKPRHYTDINKWWRGANVCTRRSWRDQPDIFSQQYYEQPTAQY